MQSSYSNLFAVLASKIRKLNNGTWFVFEGREDGVRYFYDSRSDGQDYVRTPKGPVDLPSITPQQSGTDIKPNSIEFDKFFRQFMSSDKDPFQNFDTPL